MLLLCLVVKTEEEESKGYHFKSFQQISRHRIKGFQQLKGLKVRRKAL